jgi:hypothetical protein
METLLTELLRRLLRKMLKGTLILFCGLNLACSSVPKAPAEPAESFPVGEAPWEKQEADALKEAYLKGIEVGAQTALAEVERQTLIHQAEGHQATMKKVIECEKHLEEHARAFNSDEYAFECKQALTKSKDAEVWLANFEKNYKTGGQGE